MASVRVVGGGPAGSAAALSSLLHSASVTLIEKSRLPRHKVCGEFVSPEIRGILEQLRCLDGFLALGPALIRRMTLHFGRLEKHSVLKEPAFGLSRYAFDRFLFEAAIARGARTLRETWKGRAMEEAGAKVVLATGRRAIAPAGNRLFGFKAHFTGPADDAVELFFFQGCYVGVSSVEQGMTNVSGLAPEGVLRAYEFNADELVSRSRPLAVRLGPLTRAMPWLTVGPLVFSRTFKPPDAGTYAAGDALGFTDPFTGSGMLTAVLTGAMAGQAAALGVPIPHYLRDCRRALARPFHVSAIFRTLLETGLAPWLAAPIPCRWLMQWTRPSGGLRF